MRRALQKGFTLIELMIVVAIVGILAAIAIPQYQDYTIRSQVTEGLSLASGLETAILDYCNTAGCTNVAGTWPTGVSGGGTALNYAGAISGTYVSGITTTGGGITITYGLKANTNIAAKTLGINAGQTLAGDIVWLCGTANTTTAPTGTTAIGTAVSNVTTMYLPMNCQ